MKNNTGIASCNDWEDFYTISRMFYLFFIFSISLRKCSNRYTRLKSVLFLVGYNAGGLKKHPPVRVQSSHRETRCQVSGISFSRCRQNDAVFIAGGSLARVHVFWPGAVVAGGSHV